MPRDTVVGIIVMIGIAELLHLFCMFLFAFLFDNRLETIRKHLIDVQWNTIGIGEAVITPTRKGARVNVDELRKWFKDQKNEEALMLVEALDKYFQPKKRTPKS